MPTFNREKLVVKLLREGRAVLIQHSWDTSGVVADGRRIGEMFEYSSRRRWDPSPPDPEIWKFERQLLAWRQESIDRHRQTRAGDPERD